jgi:hypothetical protein
MESFSAGMGDFLLCFSSENTAARLVRTKRTFWEKAMLIHVECNRGELRASAERFSRHWYDLVMLAKHPAGQSAIENRELFEEVVRHKKVFFYTSYADYDTYLSGRLKLLPETDTLKGLRGDYEKMVGAGMIYSTPPSFISCGVRELHGSNGG